MNEVEKMYENADIKPDCTYLFLVDGNGENEAARTISIGSKADLKRLIVDCGVKGKVIKSTNTLKPFYPPFTAKNQLDIIIFLINRKQPLLFSLDEGQGKISRRIFEEGLAGIVNRIWQDLTEEERKQIKDILE